MWRGNRQHGRPTAREGQKVSEPRLDRFKVLGAAVEFPEFTVRDLSAYTGVALDYVHKLISDRERECFEEVGPAASSGRGRPPMRWRVVPNRLDALRAALVELNTELSACAAPRAVESPAEVFAAEHTIMYEMEGARTVEEKTALLQMADHDLKQAESLRIDDARLRAVRLMIQLTGLGLARLQAAPEAGPRPLGFADAANLLFTLGQVAEDVSKEYAATVRKWLTGGPFADWTVRLRPAVERFVSLVRAGLDTRIQTVAEHVAAVLRGGVPRVEVRERSPTDVTVGHVAVTLLACNSAVVAVETILNLIRLWRRSGPLCVLDAAYNPKFRNAVAGLKAQYVPDADQVDLPALMVEAPALAALTEAEAVTV